MAISEKTKQLALQERNRLQSKVKILLGDAQDLEAQAAINRKSASILEKDIAALKKDIPAPQAC